MTRITIYSNNTYHYTALYYLLKKHVYVTPLETEFNFEIDYKKLDCIILVINEGNIYDCLRMYFNSMLNEAHLKIILVGETNVVNIFIAITGRVFHKIDIFTKIDDLIKNLILIIYGQSSLESISNYNVVSVNEFETIQLLAAGLTLNQIAKYKKKDIKSISHYKCCFFRKLGLKNNAVNIFTLTHENKMGFNYLT